MDRAEIFELIAQERARQNDLFQRVDGEWDDDWGFKLGILAEEFGEVATAMNENDPANLFEELVQTAAVAVAWLESEY